MKTIRIIGLAIVAILLCLSACSGGGDDPITPSPNPEVVKSEITIDSSIITNGLSFTSEKGEQSISFSTNENWTLSVASTTSGAIWCTASAINGTKGNATVKFSVTENTDYDNRSVSVTIKSGTASKTFTVSQKCADALLITTDKYEIAQEGGTIDIEVKANISYKMEISEEAKDWITESSSRGLTSYKHSLDIVMNERNEKREGKVYFKSGDKMETVEIYQAGGAILLLSESEYQVSDKGDIISVDIKSNIEFGVQMPDVDWIVDEASSRGLSSHTLKYIISANEEYDSRSAEIVFYDKNSDLKATLKVVQAQKDAIVISQKTYNVKSEGEIIEVKLSANVDFEVTMPEVDWISQTESRSLKERKLYFKVAENIDNVPRSAKIIFTQIDSELNDSIIISQTIKAQIVNLEEAGTLVKLLGDDYLKITSLKVVGNINGDDIRYLRQMLGGSDFKEANRGKLTTLDLSEANIVEGGSRYYMSYYKTSNNVIGDYMFCQCVNLQDIVIPNNVISIGQYAFMDCSSLTSVIIGDGVTSIGNYAFRYCSSLASLIIGESVTTIGEETFGFCSSLTSVKVGNSLISIGGGAFRDCSSLTSISIGSGVTSIGKSAFYFCNSLHSVYITDISSWLNIEFGNADNSNPLHNGAKLYVNNKKLTDLIIPEDITEIKNYAFHGCETLKKVTIGDNVTSIGKHAFRSCDALTSVSIGNGVAAIDEFAFYFCDHLTSVRIGDNVTSIGRDAFSFCDLLTNVYCYAVTPPVINTSDFNSSFEKFGDDTILYVPAKYGSIYKSSFWGNYFANIIEME